MRRRVWMRLVWYARPGGHCWSVGHTAPRIYTFVFAPHGSSVRLFNDQGLSGSQERVRRIRPSAPRPGGGNVECLDIQSPRRDPQPLMGPLCGHVKTVWTYSRPRGSERDVMRRPMVPYRKAKKARKAASAPVSYPTIGDSHLFVALLLGGTTLRAAVIVQALVSSHPRPQLSDNTGCYRSSMPECLERSRRNRPA